MKYFIGLTLETDIDLIKDANNCVKNISKDIHLGPFKGSINGTVARYTEDTEAYLVLRDTSSNTVAESPFTEIDETAYPLNGGDLVSTPWGEVKLQLPI